MAAMQRKELLAALPQSWRRILGGFSFQSVKHGMSDAQIFRLRGERASFASETLYLKAAPSDALAEFRSEIERTRWLSARSVRVPAILDVFDDGQFGVALMTALPGSHPHQAAQPTADIVAHLARGLRALHALAAGDCPFDETTAARLARARAMIGQDHIDPEEFDERNLGRSPLEIYRQLIADALRIEDDIVLVHGDATFDNLLINGDGNVGFIDCGHAGRGDRYLDLEAVTSDIEEHFGSQWIEPFARSYGVTLDSTTLRFFDDLYELF
jgi:aminoglycoside 3'-phosphotransferase II